MATISTNNVEVFYKAIAEKEIDIIKQFLTDDILMSIKNDCIRPPLHHAVWSGSKEVVELILHEVDDIDRVDSYGRTALHIAVQNGYEDIVPVLLNEGININLTCKRKKPALSYALDKINFLRDELSKKINRRKTEMCNYGNNLIFKHHHSLYQFIQIAEYIEEHLIKLETMNLYRSVENHKLFIEYTSIEYEEEEYSNMELDINFVPKNFDKQCEDEFDIIKNYKVGDHNISFYDILIDDTFDDHQLSKYAKILLSIDYKTKFKLYAGIIKNRLRRGIERNKLLLQYEINYTGKNDYFFFGDIQLNIYCINEILRYLGNEDLKNLIEADQLPNPPLPECKASSAKDTNENTYTNKRKTDEILEKKERKKICLIKK